MENKNKFESELRELANNIVDILVNKNKGYGNSFYEGLNEVKNLFKDCDDKILKKVHYFSFYVRELDKLNRFKNLIVSDIPEKDKEINIFDAVLDLAGYSMLFYNYIKNYDK